MITAYDIPFSPAEPDQWEQDPRTVWHALEEIAFRITELDPPIGTDNAVVRMDGTAGLQDSGWLLDDADLLTAAGDLDMQGNDLLLDADGDTKIDSAIDDIIQVTVGGAIRMILSNTSISMALPLLMAANRIAWLTSGIVGGTTQVVIDIAGTDVLVVEAGKVQFNQPIEMDDNRIDLDLLSKYSIRHDSAKIVFEVDGDLYTFDVVEFVCGGHINLAQGKKLILDTDDDTYIQALADDLVFVVVGGVTVFTVTAATVAITQDIAVSQTKRVDFDANTDTSIRASADDLLDFEVGGADVLQITPTELDGQSALRLTNFAGLRATFQYGWNTTNTAATRHLYTTGLSVTSGRRGYLMPRAGSIVKITMILDINAINATEINAQIYRNTTLLTNAKALVISPVVANGQKAIATFAVGTHTFAAEDDIGVARVRIGTSATTDDTSVAVEVEYDN